MSETPTNKLRELCEKWQLPNINIRGDGGEGSTDISYSATRLQCAAQLRAILPDVERLVEAAGTLAWATSVEIQGGRRTRAFMNQHRRKCTYWVEQVTSALALFDQPVAPKEPR